MGFLLPAIYRLAGGLTTILMAAPGPGVDVRVVAQAGMRVAGAVTLSPLVLGIVSFGLIRLPGVA